VIFGIGTDIVEMARIREMLERHGERFAMRVLAGTERGAYVAARDPARFLAKRFAAKEAFGKAFGTGVAMPATLHAVAIQHDALGKPLYAYDETLADHMTKHRLSAHLTLSDERDYVVAFAVIERHD